MTATPEVSLWSATRDELIRVIHEMQRDADRDGAIIKGLRDAAETHADERERHRDTLRELDALKAAMVKLRRLATDAKYSGDASALVRRVLAVGEFGPVGR